VKTDHDENDPELVRKMPLITEKDTSEHNPIRKELVEALRKMGGYVPATDDGVIDEIATAAVYEKHVEKYMDSSNATLDTYYRATETKYRWAKMIENAMHQLAAARRDRIGNQTESGLMTELREAILRGMNKSGEQ